jgi:hypothetical protein
MLARIALQVLAGAPRAGVEVPRRRGPLRSIDLVTTELVPTSPLAGGGSRSLGFVPGRTHTIPIPVTAGETISIATKSRDLWDSIAVLLAADGSPVVGSDDENAYFAAFDWSPRRPARTCSRSPRSRRSAPVSWS